MMNCENCGIKFESDTGSCPLCFEKIGKPKYEDRLYPPRDRMITQKGLSLFAQIYFFVALIAIVVSGVVNYLHDKKFTWAAVVLASVVYVFVLIRNTILAKANIAPKMLLQVILMSLFLFSVDYFLTNNSKWSLEYAIPFLLLAVTLVLTIIALSNMHKWRDYVLSILVMVLIGLVPFIFYLTKIINVLWPSLVVFLYACFTILGMLLFYRKKFTNEIKKNFHI